MSFSGRQEDPFLGPLRGHTVAFVVDSRRTSLALARGLLTDLAAGGHACVVLDIDALYSSNADYVLSSLSEPASSSTELFVPSPDSDLEGDIAALIQAPPTKVVVVDSLNSLYHALSGRSRGSRTRSLAFVMALLGFIARTETRTVFLTMYQRDKGVRLGRQSSIANFADLTVHASVNSGELVLKCERGHAWPGRIFRLPIP